MKKELTFIACCLALFVFGMAQANMPKIQEKFDKEKFPDRENPIALQKQTPQSKGTDWWEPDTVYGFNASNTQIYDNDRFICSYNSQGLRTEVLYQYGQNDNWQDGSKYTYTYDGNNNLLTESYQSEQDPNSSWKRICTYDGNNNLLTWLRQIWRNNSWVNGSISTSTYDEHNNQLTYLYQIWQNNNWVNENISTYTYDEHNNRLTYLSQIWENNNWVNASNGTYTYDELNNRLTWLSQIWENNNWVNASNGTYTYDEHNNLLTYLRQIWQNNNWVNENISTSTYDEHNNQLSYLRQKWENNSWVNGYQILRTYDENSNSTSAAHWYWVNNQWEEAQSSLGLYYNNMQSDFSDYFWGHKLTATYVKVGTVGIQENMIKNNLKIYPNPTSGKLHVTSVTDVTNVLNDIEVFDMYGRVVETRRATSLQNTATLDISHLPAGVYFLRMGNETVKVVKE
jgi:hypothetical protein